MGVTQAFQLYFVLVQFTIHQHSRAERTDARESTEKTMKNAAIGD